MIHLRYIHYAKNTYYESKFHPPCSFCFAVGALTNCQNTTEAPAPVAETVFYGDTSVRAELFDDPHSYSEEESKVVHLNWDAVVDFENEVIMATATWTLAEQHGPEVIFDVKDLNISKVTLDGQEAVWDLEYDDELLGSALVVYDLGPDSKEVAITYETSLNPKRYSGTLRS